MTGSSCWCAQAMASAISASVISEAPASSITVRPADAGDHEVEPTGLGLGVGRVENPLSVDAARAAGRERAFHGISDIMSAQEAPTRAGMSASFSWSCEKTVVTTATSLRILSSNSGRMARSTGGRRGWPRRWAGLRA